MCYTSDFNNMRPGTVGGDEAWHRRQADQQRSNDEWRARQNTYTSGCASNNVVHHTPVTSCAGSSDTPVGVILATVFGFLAIPFLAWVVFSFSHAPDKSRVELPRAARESSQVVEK